jgi:hypothetical protein
MVTANGTLATVFTVFTFREREHITDPRFILANVQTPHGLDCETTFENVVLIGFEGVSGCRPWE